MDEKVELGIEETKELIAGILVVGTLVMKAAEDGFGKEDISTFYEKIVGDEAFRKAVIDGAKGSDKVVAELKDLNMIEGLDLSTFVISTITETLKK